MTRVVVIGAGIGGLTAAALLLKVGCQVTVLETQTYAGGCAGTFFHRGYRWDAGATLAGGFSEGGPHHYVGEQLGIEWPTHRVDPIAWTVHLPDGRPVPQWTSAERWEQAHREAFPSAEKFWRTQSMLADISWDVSTRPFPWPPQDGRDIWDLARAIRPKTLLSTPYILRSMGAIMPKDDPMLRTFVDANLLISAQVTADKANALYGSAALDLPRRGVNHIDGGVGGIAQTLVDWIRNNGGEVIFKQKVDKINVRRGKAISVQTNLHKRNKKSQRVFEFDYLLGNLTPWALRELLGDDAPQPLKNETKHRPPTWGAFMLYLGLDKSKLPETDTSHHQIVRDHTKPLGETNSVFLSMSYGEDPTRAPKGMQAANISTHTEVGQWWRMRNDPAQKNTYHDKRDQYVEAMLDTVEKRLPGFREAVVEVLPATPVTYEQWTNRPMGMVGGFPQTSILKARSPWTGLSNAWLVGDSVFPGLSTAGVTLSGIRVARKVMQAVGETTVQVAKPEWVSQPSTLD